MDSIRGPEGLEDSAIHGSGRGLLQLVLMLFGECSDMLVLFGEDAYDLCGDFGMNNRLVVFADYVHCQYRIPGLKGYIQG